MESIKLTTPNRNELEYIVEPVVPTKGDANCVELNQLEASQGLGCQCLMSFLMSYPRNCQSCHLTVTSSL
jgi:hypothetical protein